MAFLNREGVLKKQLLKVEKVELDNDEHVFIKQMSGKARDRFEQSLSKLVKKKDGTSEYERQLDDFRAKLACCTLCDEDGSLLLTMEDAPLLSENMSAARLELIVNKAQEMNKISQEDKENLIKN